MTERGEPDEVAPFIDVEKDEEGEEDEGDVQETVGMDWVRGLGKLT